MLVFFPALNIYDVSSAVVFVMKNAPPLRQQLLKAKSVYSQFIAVCSWEYLCWGFLCDDRLTFCCIKSLSGLRARLGLSGVTASFTLAVFVSQCSYARSPAYTMPSVYLPMKHFCTNTLASLLQLSVKGYNDKQHILLKKIIEKMATFEIDEKRFDIIKEAVRRVLQLNPLQSVHVIHDLWMCQMITTWETYRWRTCKNCAFQSLVSVSGPTLDYSGKYSEAECL